VSLPELPLLLTFDDGYLDFETVAWPALQRYGFTAMVSVVTDLVGGSNEWDAEYGSPIPLMDWDAIRELHRQGVAFAAHSATHPRLTELDPIAATREIWSSKVRLEQELGTNVTTFVYPFNSKDEQVEDLVRGCRFAGALDGRFGTASADDDPFDLPRIEVEGGAQPEGVLETISQARALASPGGQDARSAKKETGPIARLRKRLQR
jgi:peptidoglycan/xylan/chitin deacetylase (PgdA/CDA1 family)